MTVVELISSERPVVVDSRMLGLHRMVEKAALTDISVLLLGETGCGKEVLAEAVHRHSSRTSKPFVRIHCAAVPDTLLESELFGYEKGAFSGAVTSKPGLLEMADGGTVFLDEIGDMPLPLQAKLLRVLEEPVVMRLGGLRPRPIDVRFVAATNRDLEEDAGQGRFRLDLFYRLNGFCLEIPALRDRRDEIAPLAERFLRRAAGAARRDRPPRLGREALALLLAYHWPGNVRELRNVMERAVILAGDADEIAVEHLPVERLRREPPAQVPPAPAPTPAATATVAPGPAPGDAASNPTAPASAAISERERIIEALARCGGNQSAAAKCLGMSRNWLIARVRAYDLPRPQGARLVAASRR